MWMKTAEALVSVQRKDSSKLPEKVYKATLRKTILQKEAATRLSTYMSMCA